MAEQAPLTCTCGKWQARSEPYPHWFAVKHRARTAHGGPIYCPGCGDGLYFDTAGNPQVERRAELVPRDALLVAGWWLAALLGAYGQDREPAITGIAMLLGVGWADAALAAAKKGATDGQAE